MPNRELFHLLHHDHHARYDRMFPCLWAFVALTLLTGFALDTPENIFRGAHPLKECPGKKNADSNDTGIE